MNTAAHHAPDGGDPPAPYRVEQIETGSGPRWRLAGPGLTGARAYPWIEFRDKLEELAAVMNFAWAVGRSARAAEGFVSTG